MRDSMREGWGARPCAALVSVIAGIVGLAAAAHAELAKAPDPFAVPIARGKPTLGSGYDSALATARGEPGACVEDLGTERSEARELRYSLATLSRAGGRLVVGVHVAAVTATESLASPRLTDASRRLAQSEDSAAFRDLCGDGFVARVELGGQWLAEIEVDRVDVARAGATLVTGTWSDPAPFRAALEGLVRYRTTARELPGGDRAAAREMASAAVVERAVAFPESVTNENEAPILAIFAGYTRESLTGLVLSGPGELDGREVAEQVLRGGRSESGMSSAAWRAAEMRKAVVRRDEPVPPPGAASDAAPIELSNRTSEASVLSPARRPAAPAPPETGAERAVAAGAAPRVRRQPAMVFETPGAPTVYATTLAPGGVHAERQRQRFYWVPGAARPTPAIEQAIAAAKQGTPARGVTIAVVETGAATVVMTDAPPIDGVFSAPAGERRAWIAGVTAPRDAERAALSDAIRAEAAAESARE